MELTFIIPSGISPLGCNTAFLLPTTLDFNKSINQIHIELLSISSNQHQIPPPLALSRLKYNDIQGLSEQAVQIHLTSFPGLT